MKIDYKIARPIRRVVVEHNITSLEDGSTIAAQIVPAEEFGSDFDKYEGLTIVHEEGETSHGVPVRYKQTFLYTKKTDLELLEQFN